MTRTEWYTLAVAILGVLHGPATKYVARVVRRFPVIRQVIDTVKVLWTFRRGAGN